jgi:hypothetical protein
VVYGGRARGRRARIRRFSWEWIGRVEMFTALLVYEIGRGGEETDFVQRGSRD